jgi:hypothetical protein
MSKKMLVTETITVRVIGSNRRIQLPKDSILEVNQQDHDDQKDIVVVVEPAEFNGATIRLTPELSKVLVDAAKHKNLKLYRESIEKCLGVIVERFQSLPVVDSGTPVLQMRDLGKVDAWIPDPKQIRHWLHHVNMKIPHPSLSVEQATFSDGEHLVLLLTHQW